jgi:AbiV family abortive infection protein
MYKSIPFFYFSSMQLNLRKIQQIAVLALKNGIRLHFESIHLYNIKAYPTSLFLSVIAMEEVGKAFWADHVAWNGKVNPRMSPEMEHEWVTALFGDHKRKQLSFIRQIWPWKEYMKHHAFVDSKGLDILKQNSIYVGLSKPGPGKPRTDGKIIKPQDITKAKAKKQINLVHSVLLDNAEGIEEERIYFDLKAFNNVFNRRLLEQLREVQL